MRKKIFAFLLLSALYAGAQEVPDWENPIVVGINKEPYHATLTLPSQKADCKEIISLNGKWRFQWSADPGKRPADFYKNDFNTDTWDTIIVPGAWQLQGYGKPIYSNVNYPFQKDAPKVTSEPPAEYYSYGHRNPTGSYVTTFEVTLDMKDKCLYLHFEGVKSAMYVWVNGERVGYSQNSMSPAEFDITEFVKNGTNRLAVEVYRWSDGSYLEDQDMWRLSGILRPVELWVRPRTNIRDYRFSSDLSDDMRSATFGTEIWIRNQTDRKVKDLTVEINLVGKDNRGNKLDKKMVAPVGTIQAFSETSVTLSEMLREPQLWSAEKPHLYDIHIKLRRKNELLESFEYHWGIRKIEIAGDVFKVNGKAVKLKGVNRHDFHPRMGFFVDSRTMERDIRLIKRGNTFSGITPASRQRVFISCQMLLRSRGRPVRVRNRGPSWISCALAYRRRRSASSCGSRTVRHFPFSRISVRPARRASAVMKRSSLTRIPVAQIVSITWYSRWFLRPLAIESSRRYSDSVRSRCSSRNARR